MEIVTLGNVLRYFKQIAVCEEELLALDNNGLLYRFSATRNTDGSYTRWWEPVLLPIGDPRKEPTKE